MAAQNNAKRTYYIKTIIDNTQQKNTSRLCVEMKRLIA